MSASRPYDGIRIIDLTGDLSAYATRLFANLGAEVIMVEPPEGRADRKRDPLPGAEGYGGSAFAFLNAGKKSVTLDRSTPQGWAAFMRWSRARRLSSSRSRPRLCCRGFSPFPARGW